MDNIIWGVAALLGVVFILFLFVIGLTWEFAIRSAYFAGAAKWYGWSEEEKFSVARGASQNGAGKGAGRAQQKDR